MSVPLALLCLLLGLIYKGIDRRLGARMQARTGPPVMQPLRDIRKLMLKENIVPKHAVPWLFSLMPVVALGSTLALLMYVPLFGQAPLLGSYGDMVSVLYMLLIPSLALVIGGFVSSSPYAVVGAQREMVTMISYEFPLAITIVAFAWLASVAAPGSAAFAFSTFSAVPVWSMTSILGSCGLIILFAVMIVVTSGEMGAVPFDAAEAETEIAGGLLSEYSGRNLALFYMASAVKMVVLGSVIIALFLPFGISGYAGLEGMAAQAADAGFFLLKLFAVIFAASTFPRVAVPRLRITQIVKMYWVYATAAAIIGLTLIGIDVLVEAI